ncbi:UNVERIFIED_CONTAM: Contactin-associated protein-like 5 [Gekko kuhli]
MSVVSIFCLLVPHNSSVEHAEPLRRNPRALDPFGKTDEREPLTNAVRSDSAVIGGVIAVVIFIIFCIVAIMSRFLYQHKQTHRSSQTKEKEYPEHLDSSFKTDVDLQHTVTECKREYFI